MGAFAQVIFTILTAVLWFLKANGMISVGWFWVIIPAFIVPLFWALLIMLAYIKQFLEWVWEHTFGR